LAHGVPVATGALRAELGFDHRGGQSALADPGGIDDVCLFAFGLDQLRSLDGCAQAFDSARLGRVLEKHDDQVTRVALGLRRERIAGDDRIQILGCPHEKRRLQTDALLGFDFQPRLELGSGPGLTRENDIPALEQPLHVCDSERGEHVPQLGHSDFPATAHIDGAQERDAGVDSLTPRSGQAGARGGRYSIGSTTWSLMRTSKCRWGPVDRPDEPSRPIFLPRATLSPRLTSVSRRCAYRVMTPPPCAIIT